MIIDPNKKFLYVNRDATTGEMDEALCFPVSSFIGAETQTSAIIDLYFKGSKGADATVVRVFHLQHGLIKTFYKNLVDEINFGENAFINIYDHGRRNTFPSDISFNISTDVQPTFTLQDTDFIVGGDNLTFDSVQLTGIQTSSESFADNDVSLMTSAAIDDRINTAVSGAASGDMTGVDITVGTGLDISQSNTTSGDYSATISLDLTEVGVDGSANQVLTDDGDGTVTSEGNFTYDGDNLTLTSASASQPLFKMQTTHTHGGRAAELRFIKDADDTQNGEALGFITFYGDDSAGNNQQFAKIKAEIEESTSGSEGGKLTLMVASHSGSEVQGLVIEDGSISSEVDVTLGNGSFSTVTCPGKLVAKTIQCFSANFFDDLGTTKHYVPLSTQSTAEQTSDGNTLVDFLAPCDLSIREVMLKLPGVTTGSGDITVGIETSNIGSSVFTKSIIETETVSVTSSNDNDIVHFRFDEVTHATLGQNVSVSIQSDTDLSSSQNWYVNVIMELDWNTMHTGSSSVQTS